MQLEINKNYVTIECCNCGVIFVVSEQFKNNLKRTKQFFYCPNGHGQSYNKSTADILAEEVEAKEREIMTLRDTINYRERQYKLLEKKTKNKKTK